MQEGEKMSLLKLLSDILKEIKALRRDLKKSVKE